MKYSVALLLACLWVCSTTNACAVEYEIRDLGILPEYVSYYVEGINNRGEVVGRAYTSTHVHRAFAWDAVNGMRFIADASSIAYGINNNGVAVIAGRFGTEFWDNTNGTRYIGSGIPCFDINDLGQTVGGNVYTAAIWDETNGTTTFGPLPGYDTAHAYLVNNQGQAAGYCKSTYPLVHSFFWDSANGIQDIGCLDGYYSSYASGINDLGQVVGDCRSGDQTERRGFIWDSANGIQDLGFSGLPCDINNSGQIVGVGSNGAFVWDEVSGMQYLPSLTMDRLNEADRINDNGVIAGRCAAADGYWHAVIWTPVPEPSSLLALLCGLGGIGGYALRRKM